MSLGDPISFVPLREQVYARLQDLLIARTFAPGDHLVEESLAQQLSVSRGPVREALQRLHRDGWVTLRPRHGAFVNRPTPQQIDEFFEARELVEGAASALAADRMTAEQAEELLQVCQQATDDLGRGEPPEHMAGHTARFHLLVLQGAQNHVLVQFGEQLSARSRWFFAPVVPTLAPRAWVEHREIAMLIAGGRADEASAAMRAHIARSRLSYLATEDAELAAGARGA
jgi:DNA-binding GntR family transcriptional regulator